jgi:hypothetical protein
MTQEGSDRVDIPTFDPLVTDFDVKWDEPPEAGMIPEGKTWDHGLLEFANGYVVSVLRSNVPGHESKGNEDGLWEAVATRPTTNPLMLAIGLERQPAPELDHLHTHQYGDDGPWVAGHLDSAGFNAFAASIQAAPRYEGEANEEAELDFLSMLLGGSE